MTPEQFRQIDELYHAARERSVVDRAALLASAEPDVRREVESLLAQPTGDMLLDRPAIDAAPSLLKDATVTMLTTGTLLGPYRIESKLGEGGMGEVFRAIDTRLGRAVAIKICHQQFSERFEREGRAISSLNHPNICTLHDVGPNYLVMELVEGETLAALIKKGPPSTEVATRYSTQIAAALSEAHGKGVVHRDLKPGNIMITKSGVKVLDFGLAKSAQDETITATRMVMGTPAYMAPEQREGKPADARSDIYSFGCVLYEMSTGERPGANRKRIPSRKLEKIVSRCLEKDRDRRWQSAAELEQELGKLAAGTSRWKILSATAAILAVFAAGYAYLHRAPKLSDKDTIVVADFDNKTGDTVFDDALRQGLIVQLEQSPYLSLVSDQKIRATLKLMSKSDKAPLAGDAAREVCERAGARAVLTGSIASLGTHYVMGLRADGCANGETLDNQQEDSAGKEQVLKTLGDMAGKFRAHAGESLAAIREHNVPLEEATTPSLEALKAYTAGITLSGNNYAEGALQLKRATELDHDFAAAWSILAIHYSNFGEAALSREAAIRAYQSRERASGPEKFNIEYSYHRNVTGNLEKAWESISVWRQTYPRDVKAFSLSAGYAANGTGRFEQALEAAAESIAIDPEHLPTYSSRAEILFRLGRFDEAEKAFEIAAAHRAMPSGALALRYRLASLKQDRAGMERMEAAHGGENEYEIVLAQVQALAAARDGKVAQAERLSRRAVETAQGAGRTERAAVFQAAQAVWNAFYGNRDAARQKAQTALKAFDGREVEYAAGFALGMAGEAERADALASKLDKNHPEDTQVQSTYVPTLRALAALARSDAPKAIDLLEANRRYEFAIPPLAFNHFYGNMYPLYVRGLAYLAMHREAEAAAEFSRLLAHPGMAAGDPVDAAARLQLARALAMGPAGEKSKAESAYKDLLALWKDADADIPIFQQAKAEFAKLN